MAQEGPSIIASFSRLEEIMMYSLSNWVRSSHGPDADPLGSCVLYIYPCVCGINNRKKRGEGKPETFNFLGFTHICIKKRSNEMYTVLRQTIRKRLQAKLNAVKAELRRRMHEPIPEQGKWLQTVVRGHNRYYGAHESQCAVAVSVPGRAALASRAVAA